MAGTYLPPGPHGDRQLDVQSFQSLVDVHVAILAGFRQERQGESAAPAVRKAFSGRRSRASGDCIPAAAVSRPERVGGRLPRAGTVRERESPDDCVRGNRPEKSRIARRPAAGPDARSHPVLPRLVLVGDHHQLLELTARAALTSAGCTASIANGGTGVPSKQVVMLAVRRTDVDELSLRARAHMSAGGSWTGPTLTRWQLALSLTGLVIKGRRKRAACDERAPAFVTYRPCSLVRGGLDRYGSQRSAVQELNTFWALDFPKTTLAAHRCR